LPLESSTATSWVIAAGLSKSIVTLPALALSESVSKLSAPLGSADSLMVEAPPPPPPPPPPLLVGAVPPLVLVVEELSLLLLLLPQATRAIAATIKARSGRAFFIR
jgi:hypothetical protein